MAADDAPRSAATFCGGSAISSSPTSTGWPPIEQRDNGKIMSEACAQIRYMGDYFKYYAGLADKVRAR